MLIRLFVLTVMICATCFEHTHHNCCTKVPLHSSTIALKYRCDAQQAAEVLVGVVFPALPSTSEDQRLAVVALLLDALLTSGSREVKLAQQVATIAAAVDHPLLHGTSTV